MSACLNSGQNLDRNKYMKSKSGMISNVNVTGLRFLPGCGELLSEKTVLVRLEWSGQLNAQIDWGKRWGENFANLRPRASLWGLKKQGFPADLLVPGSTQEVGHFAYWAAALTVALQRWARQPVWQGAVVSSSDRSATFALPYHAEEVFKPALERAVRLLLQWSQNDSPEHAQTQTIANTLDDWLKTIQQHGWLPNTLHFFAAARQRDIPTSNRLGMLKLGQGCYAELLDGSFTGRTSGLAGQLARSKKLTSYILSRAAIPVPAQQMAATL